MPWKETNVYDERMKFVVASYNPNWSMTEILGKFGISLIKENILQILIFRYLL